MANVDRALRRRAGLARAIGISLTVLVAGAIARPAAADAGQAILSIDHYLTQRSEVPAIWGQYTQLYVRERVRAGAVTRDAEHEGRVVLFVHGAGTPAEVAFDVPYADYSWMAYLAGAGFDVFSVDMTGYGRSTRPHVMNNACNLPEDAQRELGIGLANGPCAPSHSGPATTIASDWADIDRAVDYIRALRDVERVSLVGWSLGGPRAGGYAARHPEKVDRLVLLAPAYDAGSPGTRAELQPDERAAMTSQSRADFMDYWNAETECRSQREPAVADVVYSEMLASDPVGATWGPGMRRAPRVRVWGWNEATVREATTPMLAVAAAQDEAVPPESVRALYDDYGAEQKVLLDLGCAAHGAMWEANHLELFEASLEWLRSGSIAGKTQGVVRTGYEGG